MSLFQECQKKVKAAVDSVRELYNGNSLEAKLLENMKTELLGPTKFKYLFTLDDFPPPNKGSDPKSCLYYFSEDKEHRFVLYANVVNGSENALQHSDIREACS